MLNKKLSWRFTAKQALTHSWVQRNHRTKKISKKVAVKAFKNLSNFKYATKL